VVPNLGWGWGGGGLTSGRYLLGRVQACRRPRPPLEEPQGASCGLPGIPVFPDIFLRVQLGAVVTLSRGWSDVMGCHNGRAHPIVLRQVMRCDLGGASQSRYFLMASWMWYYQEVFRLIHMGSHEE